MNVGGRFGARALVVFATTIIAAGHAAAQPSAADQTLAEALFRDGRKLLTEDKVSEACAKFAESQRIAPALGTLLNLAVCHQREGKLATAWAEFSAAAAQAVRAGDADRQAYAQEQIRALEPQLPKLVVVAETPPEGLQVRIDQTTMGQGGLGSPIPIDPGEHQVEAVAPTKKRWSSKVRVAAQPGTTTVRIPALEDEDEAAPAPEAASTRPAAPPTPAAPSPAPSSTPQADDASASTTLGYVALGAGLVGVGVGSYFGVQTFDKKSEAAPYCDEKRCSSKGMGIIDEARTSATISTIAFGVGIAAAATGTWLLLSAASKESPAAAAAAPSLALVPAVGSDGASVIVMQSW
jgi:hypothetical protein